MKKGIILFILLFVCIGFQKRLLAHPGGHYRSGDFFNSWEMACGEVVKGNFCMAKDHKIVLEQANGKFVVLPINLLSSQDQKLALFKIHKYQELNHSPFISNHVNPDRKISSNSVFIFLFFSSSIILLIIFLNLDYLQFVRFKNLSYLFITLGFFGFAFNGILEIPKTKPSFLEEAFSSYQPQIETNWDDHNFYVSSNGIPNHNMMVGIKNWQQQVPTPQNYTGQNHWTIPLQPIIAKQPLSTKSNFMRGAIAIAVNGVPIFNALNNRGEDANLIGELDQWGGHCGRADDYHYHIAPLVLQKQSGLKPIAFALDGFAVYGEKEPDGSKVDLLDSCNGHFDKQGNYHYHGTKTYPYMIGAMRGEVKTDESRSENQISPQPFSSPIRPGTKPLHGAIITDFKKNGANSFFLTYQVNGLSGFITYTWDTQNNYTFDTKDPNGEVNHSVYTKRIRMPKN